MFGPLEPGIGPRDGHLDVDRHGARHPEHRTEHRVDPGSLLHRGGAVEGVLPAGSRGELQGSRAVHHRDPNPLHLVEPKELGRGTDRDALLLLTEPVLVAPRVAGLDGMGRKVGGEAEGVDGDVDDDVRLRRAADVDDGERFARAVGAGGGFVLVPALLFIYPGEAPETITSISLAVVFFNALSGTLAYARSHRIDFKSGLIFASATVPGAVAGALATIAVSRERFDLVFGALLIAVAGFLALSPGRRTAAGIAQAGRERRSAPILSRVALMAGGGVSTLFGFISSFFGIGGGLLYVPALVYLLRFPVHISTATSLFILTITAFTGTATHVAAGMFHHGIFAFDAFFSH